VEEIRNYIGVDTLYYLSLDGMVKSALNKKNKGFCVACFTGDYPVLWKFYKNFVANIIRLLNIKMVDNTFWGS